MATKKPDNHKLSTKDTLSIALWSIKLMFQIDKFKTIAYISMSVIDRLQPLLQTYLVAKSFDILIKLINTQGAKLNDMLPILLMLLGYNVIQSVLRFLYRYSDMSLYNEIDIKIEKVYYEKLQSLGIKNL